MHAPSRNPPPDLEQAFREHQRRVFRAAYRVTGRCEDAEDVLQTVFLRLARREHGGVPADKLASYLHRAAVNAALDVLRARQRVAAVGLEAVEASGARDPLAAPERSHQAAEIRARLRAALAGLNARHAEIFALRYLEGYGNIEIARMLGISRVAVAVVLHRVRQHLRRELRQTRGVRP